MGSLISVHPILNRHNVFVFSALVTVMAGVALILFATGLFGDGSTDDDDTDTGAGAGAGSGGATVGPAPGAGDGNKRTPWENMVLAFQIILGLMMVLAGGYIIFYKLKNYNHYVSWLSRVAWAFPIPALLVVTGLFVSNAGYGEVGTTIGNSLYVAAGVTVVGLYLQYWYNRANIAAEQAMDQLREYVGAAQAKVSELTDQAQGAWDASMNTYERYMYPYRATQRGFNSASEATSEAWQGMANYMSTSALGRWWYGDPPPGPDGATEAATGGGGGGGDGSGGGAGGGSARDSNVLDPD